VSLASTAVSFYLFTGHPTISNTSPPNRDIASAAERWRSPAAGSGNDKGAYAV